MNNNQRNSSYTPFVKRGGLYTPISKGSTSKKGAFAIGSFFVENNASDTFGVSKSGLNFIGLNVKDTKGFKKKATRRGFVFVEPLKNRNNSYGEIKTRRVKL